MLGSSRWVALGVLWGCMTVVACRGSTKHSCKSDDCEASEGGASGATSTELSGAGESSVAPSAGAAGEGGAGSGSASSACRDDADCDDGQSCNGAEACQSGQCATGTPLECSGLTECVEAAETAGCFVPAREPLVIWSGKRPEEEWRTLFGASLNQLSAPRLVDLSAGATDEKFMFVNEGWEFSPDGRRLVIPVVRFIIETLDSETKAFWYDLDQPIEGQPRRLSEIPLSQGFQLSSWSRSGSAFISGYEDDESFYAVRFTGASVETARVDADEPPVLCDDDTTVAYNADGVTYLAAAWSSPAKTQLLPASLRGRSPDGKWLLLSDEQHAYLARCGAGAKLERLGGPAAYVSDWSSDSRYVVYSDRDWDGRSPFEEEETTTKTLTGFRVESQAVHAPVFEAKSLVPAIDFEPGSTRFLFLDLPDDGAPSRRLRDIADPTQDRVIELHDEQGEPIFPHLYWLGRTGRWLYMREVPPDDEGFIFTSYYTLSAEPGSEPKLRETIWDTPYYSDDSSHMIWVDERDDIPGQRKQAYTLDLTSDTAKRHPLFPEPLTGNLQLPYDSRQNRLITRTLETPSLLSELYIVPEDFEGEPVRVEGADLFGEAALQPRP